MSEPCSIEMCKSSSRTQCHCCQKNFCRSHFIEHDNLPNLQLNVLVDEINSLNDRLMTFNVDEIAGNSRPKLEQWRVNCHKTIDDIFEEKCREIDRRANEKLAQQRDEISQIRSTVIELIRQQETTMKDIDLLKTAIHTVVKKIEKMEHTCFEVVVGPLVINNSSIHIEEIYVPQLDLSILPPAYKSINFIYNGGSLSFANNDQFFLIHQAQDLCLMNFELTTVKKSQWDYGLIWDMCWSSTLARFFVITEANVFIVDDNTLSSKVIQINQNHKLCSCTCSDTTLYLSTLNCGASILKFRLLPFMQLEKQWTSPETCAANQGIMNVVYNNGMLALIIADPDKAEKFLELRSSTTLTRLWSIRLDIENNSSLSRCCFLNHSDWLVWDYDGSCLLHIMKNGKVQKTSKYNEHPVCVCLFDGNKLAVSTGKSINCYELNSEK